MADNKPSTITSSKARTTPTGSTITVAVAGEHDVFAVSRTLAEHLGLSVSEYQRLALRSKNEAVLKELSKGSLLEQLDARHAELHGGTTLSASVREAKARARLDAAMKKSDGTKLTERERRRVALLRLGGRAS